MHAFNINRICQLWSHELICQLQWLGFVYRETMKTMEIKFYEITIYGYKSIYAHGDSSKRPHLPDILFQLYADTM